MPCPRSPSELVSESAQASLLSPPSITQTLPLPLQPSLPALWLHPAGPSTLPSPFLHCSTPSLPVPLAGSPSPAPMRRAQSSLCLRDETLAAGQRRKLSSRFPVGRSSESFSPGDTPRQRFRQRRPGPLGAPTSHGKGQRRGSLLSFAPQLPWTHQPLGLPSWSLGSPHKPCPPLLWSPWPIGCLVHPQGLAWDGMAPSRPCRNTKQMLTERVSGGIWPAWGPWFIHSPT